MKVGDKVFNLQKLFNYRLKGWYYKNDTFGDKRVYEPAQMGIFKGKAVPWNDVLKEYCSVRGWSSVGIPIRTKIADLGLEDIAKN